VYGPYDGWLPIGITTACNNFTYVLWLSELDPENETGS
jgi:hypothetical protein